MSSEKNILDDKSSVKQLKGLYDLYGSQDQESMYDKTIQPDMYDDEYDDTYDMYQIGVAEVEPEVESTYNRHSNR